MLTRRQFLQIGGTAALGGIGVDAVAVEPYALDVTEHVIPVEALPRSLEGLVVAHVTDTHLSEIGRLESTVLEAIQRHDPTVVALTGDAIERSARLGVLEDFCAAIGPPDRTLVATLGNWEHWSDLSLDDLKRTYWRVGAHLLVNETLAVDGVALVATDDGYAGRPRIDRALAVAPSGAPRILLSHSPEIFDRLHGVGPFALSLAGHTHGGQVRVGSVVPLVPPGSGRFVAGFYRTPVGPAYINRGIGTSIAPVRLGSRPEVAIFRLERS